MKTHNAYTIENQQIASILVKKRAICESFFASHLGKGTKRIVF